jgi:hypothetical protein
LEAYLCGACGAAHWQPEAPSKSAVSPGRWNRHSRECIEWPRQSRTTWNGDTWSVGWIRSAQCRRADGSGRNTARWINLRCKWHKSAGHHRNSRQRRPGRSFWEFGGNSFGRHADDYRRQHHRRRQQDRQVLHHDLRQSQELPPLRIYLGSLERYFRRRATGSANRNRIGPAHWPASWAESFWPATRAEPRHPATESGTKSSAATAVIFIAADSEAVPSGVVQTQRPAEA